MIREAADAATVWSIRRFLGPIPEKPGKSALFYVASRTVLVEGGLLLTSAHVCGGGTNKQIMRLQTDDGPLLSVGVLPMPMGDDPDITIAIADKRPEYKPTSEPYEKLLALGPQRVLAAPDEVRVHPLFADPYCDLAALADHPDARGAIESLRGKRTPLRVRRTPLKEVERVFVRGRDGWGVGVAQSIPGPSALLQVTETTVAEGDCGGPVIDENGELVGICNAGPHRDAQRGVLAQLCRALPAWIWERVTQG